MNLIKLQEQDLFKKHLLKIEGEIYFLNKNDNHNFSEIEKNDIMNIFLVFYDVILKFKTDSIGEKIEIEKIDSMEGIDMGNNGFTKILNIEKLFNLEEYINCEIKGFGKIFNNNQEVGVVLYFKNKKKLIFLNLGDEITLFTKIPTNLKREGYKELVY